jgi:uncharacterized membrane protein SirB2
MARSLMDYVSLKIAHVSCVAISYALFVVRGVWMIRGSALLQRRWVKIAPHVVDTILLSSAVAMAFMIRQYPPAAPWLTAKVVGLLIYIVLGTVALKRGKTKSTRITAWIAAQSVFAYIVAVALTRKPLPWA